MQTSVRRRWQGQSVTMCAAVVLVAAAAATARAACTDPVAVAATRAEVEASCPCATAPDRAAYLRCAKAAIEAAVDQGRLPRSCRGAVTRCAAKSTCGRGPAWVTCCRTKANGRTKCMVKSNATKCRAPAGGGSCTTGYASCCDACGAGGCAPAATATLVATPIASTPTVTAIRATTTPTPTVPAICQSAVGLPPLATVPVTIVQGSTECGGAALQSPAPAPPFSGVVADGSGAHLGDLALGCLYPGRLAGLLLPDGATAQLDVVGLNLLPLSLTLTGSAGTGPHDCTRGAGPGRACANGVAGVDGTGTCHSDADCAGVAGACAVRPNCYFGPPIPIAAPVPSCVVSAFQTDLCGRVDLLPPQATFATALSSRVYLSVDSEGPCPRCVGGVCDAGDRAGQACVPVGSAQTSVDCPPASGAFIAVLDVVIPALTTGTSTVSAPDGFFCSGQALPGAMGLSAARTVMQSGTPPGGGSSVLAMDLAATFCIGATGTFLDAVAGLPGVGALSTSSTIELGNLLP